MSWKRSLHYWFCGPFALHIFIHSLDPRQRRFYVLGIWSWIVQLWPPRSVLDYRTEWTVDTKEELLRLGLWVTRRLKEYDRSSHSATS